MKLVKESLNKDEVFEGLRIRGVTYDNIKSPDGIIYAGEQGILGNNYTLIPWDLIKKLISKYANK